MRDRPFRVVPAAVEHAGALEALQPVVFPTLAPGQRFRAGHYRHHVKMFPEGQFVAVAGKEIIASTTTLRVEGRLISGRHSFSQIFGEGWLTSHDPGGAWLYGADLGVIPEWRGRGVGRALYAARQRTVVRLGLSGQATVGLLAGYGALAARMDVETYYRELLAGERSDPTISVQLRIGFRPRGLIPGYVSDPICAGYGVLLVLPASVEVSG